MSDILRSLILGIIQGLTEFLPVSSSGHLELGKFFLNDQSLAEESMLMTVVLHVATALSTLFVFRKEVAEIFRGLFAFKWNEASRFSLMIILSMIPAVIIGLVWEDAIELLFVRNIPLVAGMLVITGLLLFLADRAKTTDKKVGWKEAIMIGLAQAFAILPGISRSGATISTSVLLHIDRERAARFSFLMVVPLILGKIGKDVMDGALSSSQADLLPLSVGFAAAFFTGLLACTWMIKLVKRSKLAYFSVYCFGGSHHFPGGFLSLNLANTKDLTMSNDDPFPSEFQEGKMLLLDKPLEWTSFDVVNKIRYRLKKLLGVKKIKVGHAGTLDPMATGLLIICTGKATKTLSSYQGLPKHYEGTITFGMTTPSYDAETEADGHFPIDHLTTAAIQRSSKRPYRPHQSTPSPILRYKSGWTTAI